MHIVHPVGPCVRLAALRLPEIQLQLPLRVVRQAGGIMPVSDQAGEEFAPSDGAVAAR